MNALRRILLVFYSLLLLAALGGVGALAWNQDELRDKVRLCLNRDAVCGLSSNRSEEALFSG